ncbi:MAG: metallophosphoesterase [Clostridia bacterium]|nr:metallophosphoesterase [Clostridia bacterium]
MNSKKTWFKVISLFLSLALIVVSIPFVASAETSSIRFGVISDIHYFSKELRGEYTEEYQEWLYNKHKEYDDAASLLTNALDGVLRNAVENGDTCVLIPGDLTKDGEKKSHQELAEKFAAFEAETGIPVFVIPGNHDVNNSNAMSFENGFEEPADITTPEDFREIYADFGYADADSVFVPKDGNKGGMLSYTEVIGGYKLIAIDSCMYSEDNGAEGNEHMTDGRIGDDLLEWILAECEDAEEKGLTVIGMQHHNLVPHMAIEEATFWPFVVEEWVQIADAYADAGMHYVFTGHLHSNDVASHVSDNGETVNDILTPTLTGYPNYYKIVDFTSDGTNIKFDMQTLDVDEYQNVVGDDGTVYEKPYRITHSFERTFGKGSVKDLLEGMIYPFINEFFGEVSETGGLVKYLAASGLDLQQIITDLIGTNGLAIGNVDILTVSTNLMGLINDIGSQVDEVYINQPELTIEKIDAILNKLLSFELTDEPATYLTDMLGYEVNEGGCTVGELATTIMLTYYDGDENVAKYPYVQSILDGFESGVLTEKFFGLLLDVVVNDLVKNEILANIDLNPGALFPEKTVFALLGKVLQGVTEALLGGDTSLLNLVNSVLGLSVVPDEYSSIDAIIDNLAGKYLTFSQFESWGYTISWMLGSFLIDENPSSEMDSNVSISYSGPVAVEVTKDNYRTPSQITMTLGNDSSTEATITWLTKYSLTASDIELIPYSDNPVFTGKPTVDSRINATSETVIRTYPGADIGLLMVILPYDTEYVYHTVKLSGLEPNTKYSYRIGDAERGWWSDAGVIQTAGDENDAFTFISLTDPQAQRPDHYDQFAEVVETAHSLYPDARFVVSAGDQVDMGGNNKHWNYFLNSTDEFLSLPFMPTTGNHEKGGAVITNIFSLPNVPEQDLDSGVFYSYEYNGVHFTVLNTNDDEGDKLSDAQIEWLTNDIKNSNAKFNIVVLHKAPYSNGSHVEDGDVEGIRSQLSALLPYLGVDLVLQGHDHVYLRTDALNTNAIVPYKTETVNYNGQDYEMKINPMGTIYSICGTSGVKIYGSVDASATDSVFPRAESIVESEYSMFSAITVDGNRLYYNAYQVIDGEAVCVDSFAIESDGTAPSDSISSAIDNLMTSILAKINVKLIWKPLNFFFDILGRFLMLIKAI